MTPQMQSAIAGVLFGIWPLLMNKSGLSGNTSSFAFSSLVLICVTIFGSFNGGFTFIGANWLMLISAGVTAGVGVLSFNGMLAKVTPQQVSSAFVIMIIVQTTIPAIYYVFQNGRVSVTKGIGFVLAIVAGILLTK